MLSLKVFRNARALNMTAILIAGALIVGALYWQSFPSPKPPETVDVPQVRPTNNTQNGYTPQPDSKCDSATAYAASTTPATIVPVNWLPSPQPLADLGLVLHGSSWGPYDYEYQHDLGTTYYRVGIVSSGTYLGNEVLLSIIPEEGVYHFLRSPAGVLVLIAKSSDIGFSQENKKTANFEGNFDCTKFSVDGRSLLSGLNFPASFEYQGNTFDGEQNLENVGPLQEIGSPSGNTPYGLNYVVNYKIASQGRMSSSLFSDYQSVLKLAFIHDSLGPVYTDAPNTGDQSPHNGFYIPAPDGTFRSYVLAEPTFFSYSYYEYSNRNSSTVKVTWTDGTKAVGDYVPYSINGCGGPISPVVLYGYSKNDLVPIGTTSTGDTVYAFADTNNKILKDQYAYDYPEYERQYLNEDFPTYAEFLAKKPLFLWYDGLGRLVKFQNASLFNGGGKCKPVIYLYPKTSQKVRVNVAPVGGITESIPDYADGWEVIATPSGDLTNLADGVHYPYLFWEGGGPNATPKEGFVIASDAVPEFFAHTLPRLGLTAAESAEFTDYWEPRMTDAPYYFVTFLSEDVIDSIAPLTIVPKPDTVIRVFMEFKPMSKYESVPPLTIKTPVRTGFTVVEWGGSRLSR